MKQELSVCMIVRDEEGFIGSAIGSVKDVATEVIVVDTGSTDRTKEIAISLGAKVLDLEWQDDFSAAKNFAIDQAQQAWVMILDADEELYKEDGEKLRRAISRAAETGFTGVLSLQFVDMAINENYHLPRVLRPDSGVRYRGRVHEMLVLPETGEFPKAEAIDVRILHKGYTSDIVKRREKVARNLKIMREIENEDPDNAVNNFHIGATYQSQGENTEAIKYYEKVLSSPDGRKMPKVFKCLLRSFEGNKDMRSAIRVASEGLELYPFYTDLRFHHGLDSYLIGDFETARKSFHHLLVAPVAPSGWTSPTYIPGSTGILARMFGALSEYELRTESASLKVLDDIMRELAKDADALFYLGKIFISAYGPEQAKKQFRDIADLKTPAVKKAYDLLFGGH